jgi:hypothetical protein
MESILYDFLFNFFLFVWLSSEIDLLLKEHPKTFLNISLIINKFENIQNCLNEFDIKELQGYDIHKKSFLRHFSKLRDLLVEFDYYTK